MREMSQKQAKINLVVYCLGYTLIFPLLASLILKMVDFSCQVWLWPWLEAGIYGVTFVVIVLGSWNLLKDELPVLLKNRKIFRNK